MCWSLVQADYKCVPTHVISNILGDGQIILDSVYTVGTNMLPHSTYYICFHYATIDICPGKDVIVESYIKDNRRWRQISKSVYLLLVSHLLGLS